ncbi:MAG TPA: hypothetical protein VMD92_08445 [Acidobacteriaceae bacterium]|jgi:hypothetical protein|nr:hypothetical protein [Acidobacteriaceae bacterium]
MARGWESKSVEEQVEEKSQNSHGPDTGTPSAQVIAAKAATMRQRQELELQRERILDERTSNPVRRAALEAALTEIESKLAAL